MESSINNNLWKNSMLTGKYVISPIDNKQYCRKNGQFLRHIILHGYTGYQNFFESLNPDQIKNCTCGKKCVFDIRKMKYKQTCGDKVCTSRITSKIRQNRTSEEWNNWKNKYRVTMSNKTTEELLDIRTRQLQTGHDTGSYKASVIKREDTCEMRYGNKKYNNSTQISQTKLEWDESRKQLFKDRLSASLNGKKLNDFHNEEMYVARRKMLEERGDIIPLDQLTEWQIYSKQVRNLTEKTYRNSKDIINPLNVPRGQNLYELDHIVPIFYGFQNNIPIELIASIENLQMLNMKQNRVKGKKYDPTISTKHEELENKNE